MTLTGTSNSNTETFGLIGGDEKLRQITDTIRTAAPSDASVLIEGESGTGKQLIATAIHELSHRHSGPFVRINCAAIPPELFEAELFGYQKDASNGSDQDKRGLLAGAAGGTLLLDEIAQMPTHLQARVFRVFQEQKLCRLGDGLEINREFRLIVTTSRNTAALLEEELLRKDLYFLISTIKIKVPALRERLDDIPVIAQHFLDHFNPQYDKKIRGISPAAMCCLLRYEWPGNVRELRSVVERAVLFCSGDEVLPECLPEELQDNDLRRIPFVIPPLMPMEEIEREAIRQTLARTSGNVTRSAQILRYPRPTFYRKLKKFGIKVDRGGPRSAQKLATSA
jgi:two-component system response regulator HydG